MEITPVLASQEEMTTLFEKQKRRSLALRKETIKERKLRLKAFEAHILSNRERIKNEIHKDFKKPLTEIDVSEIYPVLTEIRTAIKNLEDWADAEWVETPLTYIGSSAEVVWEPKGVCLIISPWNFPFNLCIGPLVSCLAAGNTAILKPSEITPHTSKLIKDLLAELFEDELVMVYEGGLEVATHLLSLPFDHIFFTGSTSAGKAVMKAAAAHLSSVTLELGGKSPTIIDATANLADAAKRIAFGKFINNGQACIAPDYVLIDPTVKDRFTELLTHEVISLFGSGQKIDERSTDYSRISSAKHFQRLAHLVNEGIEQGAHPVLTGPTNEAENFFHPVILTNVSVDSPLMEEEIFGPILPILTYANEEELIQLINSKPKPLALYIFSKRSSFQEKVIRETSAGSVCINDCVLQFTHPNLPLGGVNNSGIGKSHGH